MILPDEYILRISTGERIEVSEFAHERIPGLETIAPLLSDLLIGCAVLTRDAVESAKRGYDAELRKAVKEPVVGLLKASKPECLHIGTCIMADRRVCTARNVSGRKRIPPCYEASHPDPAQQLATAIVLAWASGRRVIVIVPDPQALLSAPSSGVPRAG